MEEGLLARSTIVEANPNGNVGDMPQSGASCLATPFLVLSIGVAVCGSLCTGCAVSSINILKLYVEYHSHIVLTFLYCYSFWEKGPLIFLFIKYIKQCVWSFAEVLIC